MRKRKEAEVKLEKERLRNLKSAKKSNLQNLPLKSKKTPMVKRIRRKRRLKIRHRQPDLITCLLEKGLRRNLQ